MPSQLTHPGDPAAASSRFPRKLRRAIVAASFLLSLAPVIGHSATLTPAEARLVALVAPPSPADWQALARFDRTLTREQFIDRLNGVFAPWHGLEPYLAIGRNSVVIFPESGARGQPLAIIRFASAPQLCRPQPVPCHFPGTPLLLSTPEHPLAGLHVAIEPADTGGAWARMEDRAVNFPGYGQICEGNLNLVVGLVLREKLAALGADVFLVRERREPILPIARDHLFDAAEQLLRDHPDLLPVPMREWIAKQSGHSADGLRFAAGLLLTKPMETRARADLVRRSFRPDITIVLQHDATPDSSQGRLTPTNRNIFFVDGAYGPAELRDPWQRYRLLTKLLGNVTPIETTVATAIAARFKATTGFAPVLYGNSATTRLVVPGNSYIVARNLAFGREHEGPVVVTEPYFMNQPMTLARLLAGDYPGLKVVAGRRQPSIYREYADCVAAGLVEAYGPRPPQR